MKKFLTMLLIVFLVLAMSGSVFAVTTTMEIVEDNICKINLNDTSYFEKKIVDSDLANHQVTLQLKVTNDSKLIVPSGELILVIDSSESMNTIVSGNKTRKDIVLESANKLVTDLLKANSTSLKIGVVTFSTGTEKDPNTGYLLTGTAADAQKVCDLSNNVSTLTSKISSIEGTGQYTNLDSGLQLAKKCFSSENNNKYMIVLTDGLPNLAVGYNDLVTYDGLTNVINQTKSTLTSLSGINVTTMLTGIENEEATFRATGTNVYTYGQVIKEVFGTEQNPTIGKFYNVNDNEIEQTITNNIYHDLLPIASTLEDITVVDYFPQYIVNNFELTYVEGIDISNISANIDTTTNSITWKINSLSTDETAIIQYKLTLKDNFDEKIIGQILNTNEKIDITYKDFDGTNKNKSSDVTPKIRLVAPQEDPTIAPIELPKAGLPFAIFGLVTLIGISAFLGYKSRK